MKSLSAQGIEREPTKHKGVAATAMERRNRAAKQTEKMQVSEQSESLSGYDFGQKAPVVEDPNTAEIIFQPLRENQFRFCNFAVCANERIGKGADGFARPDGRAQRAG